MATKELPCIVLSNNKFRIVAKERTKQAPSNHALHMVVDLKDATDPADYDCVDLFAEQRSVDSMGSESWSSCDIGVAKNDILSSQVRQNMEDKSPKSTKITGKQKS